MTTLREQAAIAAMQGLLAHGADGRTSGPLSTAMTAVEYADALLAELERTFPQSERTAPEPVAEPIRGGLVSPATQPPAWVTQRTAPKPAADATRLTCTAAERELIEAALDGSWNRLRNAVDAVRAERRSALPGAGGES